MRPIKFPTANGTLMGGPAEKYGTSDDVKDLPVWRGDGEIVSCWELTLWDRLRVLFTGVVWLRVAAYQTHAPVCVEADWEGP